MAQEPSRRQHILNSCERLLRCHGPARTTMAEVAREAGVAVGSLYLEFDSKEAILLELASSKHDDVLAAMRAAMEGELPCSERLRRFFEARLEGLLRVADRGHHGADLIHCQHSAVQAAYDRFVEKQHGMLAQLLSEGVRSGELEIPCVEVTARAVLTAYARFAPPWAYDAPREETRLLLGAMHDVVLFGLVRRSGHANAG